MRARSALIAGLALLSSGCVMRYTHQDIDGTWYDNKVKRGWSLPVEAALTTNDIGFGVSAIALSLEFSSQGLDPSAVPPVEAFESISMNSVMVGGRFYPLARGAVLPYGGGGFGRTQLSAKWIEYEGGWDPLYKCVAFCDSETEAEGSLASGYHPYLAGGVELRPGFIKPSLLLEYRRDFNRGNDFYQLSGRTFSVGLRFRTN